MTTERFHAIRVAKQSALQCIEQQNWYAALVTALSLPDQCAFTETGSKRSNEAYVNWFDTWLLSKYSHEVGFMGHIKVVYLSGNDMYAMRCALLHRASSDLRDQKAKEILDHIQLVVPDSGGQALHLVRTKSKLYIQIDLFVREVCEAVDSWLAEMEEKVQSDTAAREVLLSQIQTVGTVGLVGERNLMINTSDFKDHEEAAKYGVTFPANWPYFSS